jgi:hypothetical protein
MPIIILWKHPICGQPCCRPGQQPSGQRGQRFHRQKHGQCGTVLLDLEGLDNDDEQLHLLVAIDT